MNSTDRDILVKNILVGPHDYTWTAYHLALAINKAILERMLEKAADEVRFMFLETRSGFRLQPSICRVDYSYQPRLCR